MPEHAALSRSQSSIQPAPVGNSPPAVDAGANLAVSAAFVISANGDVVATNHSAGVLLAVEGKSLVGLPFVRLFTMAGDGPDVPSVGEWKPLCAAALDRWMQFTAHAFDGRPRAVQGRLERSIGGAGSYIAIVRTAAEPRER